MARTTMIAVLTVLSLSLVVAFHAGVGGQEDAPKRKARIEARQQRRDMSMQCPMMAGLKGIELHADSAAVLLGQKEELKLTEEQIEKLNQIQETSRQQARVLLTDEQREQLPKADGPLSMMELCMQRMQGQRQDRQAGSMCPMCMRMMQTQHAEQDREADRLRR